MQQLEPQQIDEASLTLALAFHEDPLLLILQPDAAQRTEFGQWFMGTFLKVIAAEGEYQVLYLSTVQVDDFVAYGTEVFSHGILYAVVSQGRSQDHAVSSTG